MDKTRPTEARLTLLGQRYSKTMLTVVTLLCLLPFADKAFHIDDPLFVWAGRQMQLRWWDPYGFQVNWYGYLMPFHQVTKNPPLASAYIAVLAAIFGETEFMLHLGFFFQAVALILGTYFLARRLCNHPVQAALVTLFTPVFMVSSTSLMCDTLMAAFWVWAVVLWTRGLERDKPTLLVSAALLVGACSLAKYFGLALIPLLFVYTLKQKGRLGLWILWFLIPIAVIGLYEVAMRSLYGHDLVWDAFSYASESPAHRTEAIPSKLLIALGFLGGCCPIVLILLPTLSRSRSRLTVLGILSLLFVISWVATSSLFPHPISMHIGISVLWMLFIAGGLVVLALPILDWLRNRDADALLLLLWVWGTFAFCLLNWTINGRSVLPMLPAVAIVFLRRVQLVRRATPFVINVALVGIAILSLLISLADFRLADAGRTAATEIQRKFAQAPTGTIWFQGHWGFQYYAQAKGFRPFDVNHPRNGSGDILVLPSNNTNLQPLPENTVERIGIIEVPVAPCIATMSRAIGAGFYANVAGPLPFSFGVVPPEKYYLVKYK